MERRERGVLVTPEDDLDGVGFRRAAGVVRGRPGGVERLEMGANDRGGARDLIGGLGMGVYGLNVTIEEDAGGFLAMNVS